MSDKKNIDQLFKERFKDFEAAPSPQVWENIQSQMAEKKEDRKVIPLWWKLGGIAALLALLLTVGNAVFNPFDQEPSMVTEDVENVKEADSETNTDAPIISDTEESVIASEENTSEQTIEKSDGASENSSNKNIKPEDKTLQIKNAPQNTIANENTETKVRGKTDSRVIEKNKIAAQKQGEMAVAASDITKGKKVPSANKVDADILVKKTETTIAVTNEENTKDKNAMVTDTAPTSETTVAATEDSSENKKQSIFDAIEATETAAVTVKNKPKNRWEVAPNLAPVYYNTLSEGSSIDPMFADNSQNGDVNLSYGVQVSYAITDRLSVRSGVSNVDLSYATGNIELATGPADLGLRSINYNNKSIVTIPVDKGSITSNSAPGNPFDNLTPKSASGNVQLVQNITYYEVPVELKYALFNNKFGINVLGGFSTLFLGNNEVSIEADNLNESLGEANNLSNVSFTTNVGLGFDYKISKKFKFNIEPMFKYQLNPYTDSSVDFKPYYLGVYTGFSFKF